MRSGTCRWSRRSACREGRVGTLQLQVVEWLSHECRPRRCRLVPLACRHGAVPASSGATPGDSLACGMTPESVERFRVVRADGTYPDYGVLSYTEAFVAYRHLNRQGGRNAPYRIQEMVWQDVPPKAKDVRSGSGVTFSELSLPLGHLASFDHLDGPASVRKERRPTKRKDRPVFDIVERGLVDLPTPPAETVSSSTAIAFVGGRGPEFFSPKYLVRSAEYFTTNSAGAGRKPRSPKFESYCRNLWQSLKGR